MAATPQQFGMQIGQQIKKALMMPNPADFNAKMRGEKTLNPLESMFMRANPNVSSSMYQNTDHWGIKMLGDAAQKPNTFGGGASVPGIGGQMPQMPHMQMPQMMTQRGINFGGTGQGGIAGSNDPYSMSLAGKQASMMSLLGGGLGAGVGGLAGGVGGGLMGAMTGGAIGGAPGAGLGLLGGGALGLGAGAHLGGNIGASIGKKKKKDNEPKEEESAETEEKSDEGDEEVKKSAAAVLARLQKNA